MVLVFKTLRARNPSRSGSFTAIERNRTVYRVYQGQNDPTLRVSDFDRSLASAMTDPKRLMRNGFPISVPTRKEIISITKLFKVARGIITKELAAKTSVVFIKEPEKVFNSNPPNPQRVLVSAQGL